MVQDNRVSSSGNTITKKKPCGSGRRKIEIKRIEKTCRRRVAFSKRRKGLFNKAGELCRLCDANIAIIIFSSSGRMFTFGHPSPENVVNRFLYEDDDDDEDEDEDNNTGSEEVDQSSADEEWFWWKKSVEGLSTEELEKYKDCLQGLKNNVGIRLEEMVTRRNCEKDFLSLI